MNCGAVFGGNTRSRFIRTVNLGYLWNKNWLRWCFRLLLRYKFDKYLFNSNIQAVGFIEFIVNCWTFTHTANRFLRLVFVQPSLILRIRHHRSPPIVFHRYIYRERYRFHDENHNSWKLFHEQSSSNYASFTSRNI